MKEIRVGIVLGLCIVLGYGCFSSVSQESPAVEKDISKEDSEIVGNLDFLDDLDLLNEDLGFLEDYENIYQSELTGEGHE